MLYPLKCECGHEIDLQCTIAEWSSMLDKKQAISCEKCNKPMRRVYTTPGIIFKGDGWPSKDIKQQSGWDREDRQIKKAKKKVIELKDSGQVPQDEVINVKNAKKLIGED